MIHVALYAKAKDTIQIRVCSYASFSWSKADYFQVAKLLLNVCGVCCYIALKPLSGVVSGHRIALNGLAARALRQPYRLTGQSCVAISRISRLYMGPVAVLAGRVQP